MKDLLASDILSSEQLEHARRVADEFAAERGLDEKLAPYKDLQHSGEPDDKPVLHLEDVTGIPFLTGIPGIIEYQHRARVRAGAGDLFAAVTSPADGYEAYCRDKLGLGDTEIFQPAPVAGPMAIAKACAHPDNLGDIVDWASARGGLTVHPYMATEPVWQLARALADQGVDAGVIGPPPPVLWIANDKSALADVVDRVADGAWNVETHRENTPEAMAERLLALAERHRMVALKRTRCASAMGNIVYESAMLRRAGAVEVDRNVRDFLETTQWDEGETVLAVEWAESQESPSTQMWIPPEELGEVRLDGVYQQILSGPERIFVGSRPSTLPQPVNRALAEASFVMATTFQRLGYVGRCSFDFIIGADAFSAERADQVDIRMTECNGRWGGTSTPMHLVDRLVDGDRPAYVAQDFIHPELVGAKLPHVLEAVGDELFDPQTQQGRFVFFNPGPLTEKGKIDVICFGPTPAAAREAVERELPELLGLS